MTPSVARPLTIVADDLTGACDTGAVFAGGGRVPVGVWPARPRRASVRVVDTESRRLAPGEAAARVRKAAGEGRGAWFKKIDSTLRGPVGAEIDALITATHAAGAIVCPAFPAQGRVVTDRVLYVDGRPVAETALARDPAFPLAGTSNVVELLRPQVDRPLAWVPLDHVRAGREALAARLARLAGMIIVADAETDDDLAALLGAAAVVARPPLLVGAAGLARALAAHAGRLAVVVEPPTAHRWLVVAGSRHPATLAQLEAARAAGIDVVAAPDADEGDREAVAARLAAEARARIDRDVVDGLIVTGGDTALALLAALEIDTLEIEGPPADGLALARIAGPHGPITLVTKAGGFGPPALFVSLAREAVA